MAYIYPYLELESKQGIKGIASDNFESKRWQRWSRHRTKENPWRAGIDGVETHLLTVEEWLKREVSK